MMGARPLLLRVWAALLFCAIALAASDTPNPPTGVKIEPVRNPPRTLWHWTDPISLENYAFNLEQSGHFFNFPLYTHSISEFFPELKNRPVLFTWNHPVGGIGAAIGEMYGDGRSLLRVRMKSETRYTRVEVDLAVLEKSANERTGPLSIPNLKDIDVINFVVKREGKIEFQEFVILNESAISNLSADPNDFKSTLQRELEKLKNPDFHYPQSKLLSAREISPVEANRKLVLGRLRELLKADRSVIPAIFLSRVRCKLVLKASVRTK